eukprot:2694236-Prymnesium_polylepis.1
MCIRDRISGASLIVGSRSEMDGGALRISGGHVVVTNVSSIVESRAGHDGGAVHMTGGRLEVANMSTIVNSTAGREAGALEMSGGWASVLRSRITNSKASSNSGAFAHYAGVLKLEHAVIEESESVIRGGHIVSFFQDPTSLFIATNTEFRQRRCDGKIFDEGVNARAQVVLRNITFTPLIRQRFVGDYVCTTSLLSSRNSFYGFDRHKKCGDTYVDSGTQMGVCSSRQPAGCSSEA